MTALSVHQLKQLVDKLQVYLEGSRLQSVMISDRFIWLEFYQKGPIFLGIRTLMNNPSLGVLFEEIKKPKKLIKKPLGLFLHSHAVGHRFSRCLMKPEYGRVFSIFFGQGDHELELELRLIPHAFNLVAYSEGKRVAFSPIKELALAPPFAEREVDLKFNLDSYFDEWREQIFSEPKTQKSQREADPEFLRQQMMQKKQQGLERLQDELTKQLETPWGRIGEQLKLTQSLVVPEEWEKYINPKAGFSENLQLVFHNHRVSQDKIESLKERIVLLQQELQSLMAGELPQIPKKLQSGNDLLKKAKAAGRKFLVRDDIEAVLGKSAKDNLAILRQAQSWDIWVHLKDLPSSHAVIRRKKKDNITQQDILKVGRWVLEQSLSGKRKLSEGERYDLIYCECRFVKPIKGDKLGRVTFANAQTLTLRV